MHFQEIKKKQCFEENSKSAICKNKKNKTMFWKKKIIWFSGFLLKKFGGRPENVIIAENCSAADPRT